MTNHGGVRNDIGWIKRQFRDQQRQIKELRAAKRIPGSSFPPGVIPTSALQAPDAPGFVNQTVTAFSLGTTSALLIDTIATVPSGFTSCVVSLVGRVYAVNPTGSTGFLSAQVAVAGSTGNAMPLPVATTLGGLNVATFATVLTGLSGGSTLAVQLSAWTDAAWTSDPSNTADLTGSLVWFA